LNTVEPIRDLGKIEAMKKILRGQNVRDWLLFILGINSALRVSDLLRLKQSDVCRRTGAGPGCRPHPGAQDRQSETVQIKPERPDGSGII
jgi:integrase